MVPDLFLATADADRVNPSLSAAWIATIAALLLSIGLRHRLALGVAEALFVAGVSALLLLNYVALGDLPADPTLLSGGLVSLTVVWFMVAVWIERTSPDEHDQLAQRRRVRQQLALQAIAVAGLLSLSLAWSTPETVDKVGLLMRAGLLFCVALGLYQWRRLTLARYAAVAVVLVAITSLCAEPLRAAGTVIIR